MRPILLLLTGMLLYCAITSGHSRRHRPELPKTEVELMTRVLECLRAKDSNSYYYLFPPFDSLWKMVMHNPDNSVEAEHELAQLREHPTVLIDLDPFYNASIVGRFVALIKKGDDSGINWNSLVIQRYELQKLGVGRGMEGLQRIAPERFRGFLFVRDMASSTTYCITITEIQKISGYWFGGQLLNILEAKNIDQYLLKEEQEHQYYERQRQQQFAPKHDTMHQIFLTADNDSAAIAAADSVSLSKSLSPEMKDKMAKDDSARKRKDMMLTQPIGEEEGAKTRKQVVDRKYYKGMFDEEIPVELYVRYMKDAKGKVSNWDALYKFGDMTSYVKLDVTKSKEGLWIFEEPVATMELDLNDKSYTGGWTNGENQTGYDVELTQKELPEKKIQELDKILETGTWGSTQEQEIKEKGDDADKKDDAKERGKKKSNSESDDKKDKSKDNESRKERRRRKAAAEDGEVTPLPKKTETKKEEKPKEDPAKKDADKGEKKDESKDANAGSKPEDGAEPQKDDKSGAPSADKATEKKADKKEDKLSPFDKNPPKAKPDDTPKKKDDEEEKESDD